MAENEKQALISVFKPTSKPQRNIADTCLMQNVILLNWCKLFIFWFISSLHTHTIREQEKNMAYNLCEFTCSTYACINNYVDVVWVVIVAVVVLLFGGLILYIFQNKMSFFASTLSTIKYVSK